ncbi:MAG: type II toxin-antitoxin system RelE/ParE family toxin [Pirellulales bacterium]
MNYTIVLLPQAEKDFEEIYLYLLNRSPNGATSWANEFYSKLKSLETTSTIYGFAAENDSFDFELRQLIFKTKSGNAYRALFSILDGKVVIRHIRGTGEDYIQAE